MTSGVLLKLTAYVLLVLRESNPPTKIWSRSRLILGTLGRMMFHCASGRIRTYEGHRPGDLQSPVFVHFTTLAYNIRLTHPPDGRASNPLHITRCRICVVCIYCWHGWNRTNIIWVTARGFAFNLHANYFINSI